MNKASVLGVVVFSAAMAIGGVVRGDGWFEREGEGGGGRWFGRSADVAPVQNTLYAEECGACHFAYQPGLLPARSWEAIMGGLADHFGENAELDPATRDELTAFLTANAADRSDVGRSPGIAASVDTAEAPLRITDTRYFRRKHHEIHPQVVEGNPEVGSFSHCNRCHTGAAEGNYNEHQVRIPGYGRWED